MSTKGRLSILGVMFLAACAMLTALALTPSPAPHPPIDDEGGMFLHAETPPVTGKDHTLTAAERRYWVHEHDGFVAVFDADSRETPLRVTNIAVHTLRYGDQVMFRGGVLIEGDENLSHFLEDFGP